MASPTERDLVPTGQPYGTRDETMRQMRAAGLPQGSQGGGLRPQDVGGVPDIEQDMVGFDALTTLQPSQPQGMPSPRLRAAAGDMLATLELSPNPVAQAVARRLRGL